MPKETDSGFDIRRDMIGTGAYMLDNYTPSSAYTFKRNPDYYDKDHPLRRHDQHADRPRVRDRPGAVQGRQHPHLGRARPPTSSAVKNEAKDINIYQGEYNTPTLNTAFGYQPGSPFLDERVRQAFSMSLDRDLCIDTFYNVANFEQAGPAGRHALEHRPRADRRGLVAGPQGQGLRPQRQVLPAQRRRGEEAAGGRRLRQRPRDVAVDSPRQRLRLPDRVHAHAEVIDQHDARGRLQDHAQAARLQQRRTSRSTATPTASSTASSTRSARRSPTTPVASLGTEFWSKGGAHLLRLRRQRQGRPVRRPAVDDADRQGHG